MGGRAGSHESKGGAFSVMRYDQEIVFVAEGTRTYDEVTGDYINMPAEKIIRSAHVSDMGLEQMNLLYGTVVEQAKVVRIQGAGPVDFDHIEIDGDSYSVTLMRRLRHETTFQVVKKQ